LRQSMITMRALSKLSASLLLCVPCSTYNFSEIHDRLARPMLPLVNVQVWSVCHLRKTPPSHLATTSLSGGDGLPGGASILYFRDWEWLSWWRRIFARNSMTICWCQGCQILKHRRRQLLVCVPILQIVSYRLRLYIVCAVNCKPNPATLPQRVFFRKVEHNSKQKKS
jgi:hypothetical protein